MTSDLWPVTTGVIDSRAEGSPELLLLDIARRGTPFPRIHEGRYEVDPVTSGIQPIPSRLVETVREAGIRFLRVGLGVWLPGPPFEPGAAVADREWFCGRTRADVADPASFNFTHLDRNLEVCLALGCDVLLNIDY